MRIGHQPKGIANIWAIMTLMVLVAFLGLALDASYAFLSAHQLQNTADAASLAGAQVVRKGQELAYQAAATIASCNSVAGDLLDLVENPDNGLSGDVVIGYYSRKDRTFTPSLWAPNAVKVNAKRTETSPNGQIPLLFGPIFGFEQVALHRAAIAMIGGGTGDPGIWVGSPDDKWTFRLSGTVTVDLRDLNSYEGYGVVQINSEDVRACKIDGGPELLADAINCCAETLSDPPESDMFDVNLDSYYVPDPLADVPAPLESQWGPEQLYPKITGGPHALSPGYYPDGIDMSGGDVTLAAGLYVLDGMGLNVTGGNLTTEDVMFYITDSTPGDNKPSCVNLVGNGAVSIHPYQDMPWEGMTFFQARDNPNPAKIVGTDQFDAVDGTLYFPVAHVDISGTSDSFNIGRLLCDTLEISGTGTVTVEYEGDQDALGNTVFLVE